MVRRTPGRPAIRQRETTCPPMRIRALPEMTAVASSGSVKRPESFHWNAPSRPFMPPTFRVTPVRWAEKRPLRILTVSCAGTKAAQNSPKPPPRQRPSKPRLAVARVGSRLSTFRVMPSLRGKWIDPLRNAPGSGSTGAAGAGPGKRTRTATDSGSAKRRSMTANRNTVHWPGGAILMTIVPGYTRPDGPDRPPHRGDRVPPLPDLLRSGDRSRELRRRRVPGALHVRRPAQPPALHGLHAPGVRHRDRRRAVRGGRARARVRDAEAGPRAARAVRVRRREGPRARAGRRVPLHEPALRRLPGHGPRRRAGVRSARGVERNVKDPLQRATGGRIRA